MSGILLMYLSWKTGWKDISGESDITLAHGKPIQVSTHSMYAGEISPQRNSWGIAVNSPQSLGPKRPEHTQTVSNSPTWEFFHVCSRLKLELNHRKSLKLEVFTT